MTPVRSWLAIAMELVNADRDMVLATIWHKSGYSPDNIGARLIVTDDTVHGSMNSGRRREKIASSAREFLYQQKDGGVERYPLGSILGTGNGNYEVVFSVFRSGCNKPEWLVQASQLQNEGIRFVLSQTISSHDDNVVSTFKVITPDICASYPLTRCALAMLAGDLSPDTTNRLQTANATSLLQMVGEPQITVGVIGSTDVTTSLVAQLSHLPVSIQWLAPGFDSIRDNSLSKAPLNPETLETLPNRTMLVIATGNHEMDFLYCKQALESNTFAYIGCIGSAKKASLIKERLTQHGVASHRLMIPIGIPSIHSKQPAFVAASIIAQILSFHDNNTSSGTDPVDIIRGSKSG